MVAIRIQDVHETHHMTPGAVAGYVKERLGRLD